MSQPAYLLEANDFVMKKKILSLREHYDFEDLSGAKIGEADGNLFQVPAKFDVIDTHGLEVMHLEGKILSLRKQFTFHGASGEELGTIKKKIVKLIGEEFWVKKMELSSCVSMETSPSTIIKWQSAASKLHLSTRNGWL